MIGRSSWCRECLAGALLAIVAGGGCADSVVPEPVAVETRRSVADGVGVGGETTADSKAAAVETRISETGRRQQPAIATLREAGWTVETNGVEEAVRIVGEERARAMVVHTPRDILSDLPVQVEPPRADKGSRRWLRLWPG